MGYILRVFAGERLLVEHLTLAARNQTWVSIDASDQPVAIAGYGIARVRPETGRHRTRRYRLWALESNDRFRVARVEQLIGPVAAMDAMIVH